MGRMLALASLMGMLAVPCASAQVSRLPTGSYNILEANNEPKPADQESAVSFLDSALPRTQIKIRFDAGYNNVRPDRAEYLYPKTVFPGARGWAIPETRVDQQELTSYVEYAVDSCFSVFLSSPLRFVNPENNPNTWGSGDLDFGAKYVCFADELFYLTLQARFYVPTGQGPALGTRHFTFEPALLGNVKLWQGFRLEGEFRYWLPMGGTDWESDLFRYGLGLSYGQRLSDQIWLTPVAEVVGWTILDGRGVAATSQGTYYVVEAQTSTIVNTMAGFRLGFGERADVYLGYSHCLTGPAWFRDLWRVEFRWVF